MLVELVTGLVLGTAGGLIGAVPGGPRPWGELAARAWSWRRWCLIGMAAVAAVELAPRP